MLSSLGPASRTVHLLMYRAFVGNGTGQLALDLGLVPVGPPLKTRIEPWEYEREMCKHRNEVERLFRRLEGYRQIFSRFEKTDLMFLGFISFVLVTDGLRMRQQAPGWLVRELRGLCAAGLPNDAALSPGDPTRGFKFLADTSKPMAQYCL